MKVAEGTVDYKSGSRHKVFTKSFDCKECLHAAFIEQKLVYMHNNPVSKHWKLAEASGKYPAFFAGYYFSGEQGMYPITNYLDLYNVPVGKIY
ncbi:MAG: hypothetical protein R2794_13640 [Chitinophagales bacterium]